MTRTLSRAPRLPWIAVAPGAPYFMDEAGKPWTSIGHNDAISWINLAGLFRRRDPAAVESHLRMLVEHGVTCIRLMIEYAQVRHRYFERPAGVFVPAMVQLLDDLFAMCERVGLRVLLTPVDTFRMWLHWRHHPWNRALGGPFAHPSEMLLCGDTRAAIKARLEFIVRRWGGSGALLAWDLWNEIHSAQARDSADDLGEFIAGLSAHVRTLEHSLYGRGHPQTVSLFGPELQNHPDKPIADAIFRHPDLDVATVHIYRHGAIDDPKDTVAPATAMARVVRECLAEITDTRPFLDTEHGPIHLFKDKRKTLPAAFDDEMFRHMSWAHLASGRAGGGMRWPNRRPHVLTPGMHTAQGAMARFLPLIDWAGFRRRGIGEAVSATGFHRFGCASDTQALVWLLRRYALTPDGTIDPSTPARAPTVTVPGPRPGRYRVTGWDTAAGMVVEALELVAERETLRFTPGPIVADRAFAITRID